MKKQMRKEYAPRCPNPKYDFCCMFEDEVYKLFPWAKRVAPCGRGWMAFEDIDAYENYMSYNS